MRNYVLLSTICILNFAPEQGRAVEYKNPTALAHTDVKRHGEFSSVVTDFGHGINLEPFKGKNAQLDAGAQNQDDNKSGAVCCGVPFKVCTTATTLGLGLAGFLTYWFAFKNQSTTNNTVTIDINNAVALCHQFLTNGTTIIYHCHKASSFIDINTVASTAVLAQFANRSAWFGYNNSKCNLNTNRCYSMSDHPVVSCEVRSGETTCDGAEILPLTGIDQSKAFALSGITVSTLASRNPYLCFTVASGINGVEDTRCYFTNKIGPAEMINDVARPYYYLDTNTSLLNVTFNATNTGNVTGNTTGVNGTTHARKAHVSNYDADVKKAYAGRRLFQNTNVPATPAPATPAPATNVPATPAPNATNVTLGNFTFGNNRGDQYLNVYVQGKNGTYIRNITNLIVNFDKIGFGYYRHNSSQRDIVSVTAALYQGSKCVTELSNDECDMSMNLVCEKTGLTASNGVNATNSTGNATHALLCYHNITEEKKLPCYAVNTDLFGVLISCHSRANTTLYAYNSTEKFYGVNATERCNATEMSALSQSGFASCGNGHMCYSSVVDECHNGNEVFTADSLSLASEGIGEGIALRVVKNATLLRVMPDVTGQTLLTMYIQHILLNKIDSDMNSTDIVLALLAAKNITGLNVTKALTKARDNVLTM